MTSSFIVRASVGGLLLGLWGCGQKAETPAAPVVAEPTPAAPVLVQQDPPRALPPMPTVPTAAVQAPTNSIVEPSFKMTLLPAGAVRAGAVVPLALSLEATGGYHVNQDYPTRIDLTLPAGVTAVKTSFAKAEAKEFSDPRARFEMPVTPAAAGDYDVVAKVAFAVCTEEHCVPDERTLTLRLQAEAP